MTEKELQEDFRLFLWIIFKEYLTDILLDPTPIQYDIASYLADSRINNKVIMAFRGIGKTYITALYCMWRLWKDPNLSILVISASKDHSDKISTFMWRIMKEVDFLMHMDPERNTGKERRTSRLAFDVADAPNKPSPSVKSLGITGMITGSRADIIIADDCEIPNNSDTPLKREKLVVRTEEFSAIATTGEGKEVIFLGTPQSQDTVYSSLPTEGKHGYDVRIWPSEYPVDQQMLNYYGKRLAPSIRKKLAAKPELAGLPTDTRFDQEELDKRRAKYGKSGYALQYLLNTQLSDELRHPLRCKDLIMMDVDPKVHPERPVWSSADDSMIEVECPGFEGDYFYRPSQLLGEWIEYQGGVMTIDPSGRGHDETAYCVLKWGNGFHYVLDLGGVPGGFEEETLERLANIAQMWGVRTVVPERNFGGGMFGQLMRPVLRRIAPNAYIPEEKLLPYHTTQKEARIIKAVEAPMNMHRICMNVSIIASDKIMHADVGTEGSKDYQFFHQLSRITHDRGCLPHDDRLDAFAMAVAWAQRAMGTDPDLERESRGKERHEEAMERYIEHGFTPDFALKRNVNEENWLYGNT